MLETEKKIKKRPELRYLFIDLSTRPQVKRKGNKYFFALLYPQKTNQMPMLHSLHFKHNRICSIFC